MIDTTIIIVTIALLFSIFSIWANHKLGDRKKVKAIQKEVNEFQKKYEKAVKEKDDKEIARLKLIESQVMGKMQEMLLLPLKSMIVILPVFYILIYGINWNFLFSFSIPAVIPLLVPNFQILLPVDIHPGVILGFKFGQVFQPANYGQRGFFVVCSIIFNLVLELVYTNLIDKPKLEKSS